MSDEPKSDKPNGEWVMPEPVYRSSPGHTPKSAKMADPADEIPTEPGFTDEDNVDTLVPGFVDADDVPTERPIKAQPVELPKKKRGCARSFLTMVGVIALAVTGLVIAVIYFLFYYKSADSTF